MKNKKIYLVCQTQPSEGMQGTTIYALTSEQTALEYVRKLNRKYAEGVKLSAEGDFLEEKEDIEDIHYYTISVMCLNESLK